MTIKTREMLAAEEREGRPLEDILPGLWESGGLQAIADRFNLSESGAWRWLGNLGYKIEKTLVRTPDGPEEKEETGG